MCLGNGKFYFKCITECQALGYNNVKRFLKTLPDVMKSFFDDCADKSEF